jgi:predicted dehydrogenase
MNPIDRRRFIKSAAVGTALAAAWWPARSRAAGASERVRVAVIGCGSQGKSHLNSLGSLAEAEVAAVCDVDQQRLAAAAGLAGGAKPVSDFRRVLDDPSIDGVTIATPDHWHVPVAIMALDAGKNVYVEKPCCHNVREGQLLLEAAQKSGKVVAHGTQSRSSVPMRQAIEMLRQGLIGDVLQTKCWNWQMRKDIGRMQPSSPPEGVDYDTWVGPAEWMPFQANRFHYDWHWWHNFGCGDLGNDGIHELDYALWGLGVETPPTNVSALGGKYYFDDDQQFPDTQQVAVEFVGEGGRPRMLVYEQRLWSTTYPYNVDSGVEFIGTKGKMFISKRGKFEVRNEGNDLVDTKLDMTPGSALADNHRNWIECIKSGDVPNANLDAALRAALVVHLANISTRVGRSLRYDSDAGRIANDGEANALLSRKYREGGHWAVPAGA